MLSRRIVVQSFAVVMGLVLSLQCGEAVAGKWKFTDTQYEANADYDFKLKVLVYNDQTEMYDSLGQEQPYSSNGGDPQWMIYSWSVSYSIASANGQNDLVVGSVYRKDLLASPVVWLWHESIDPVWVP